MEHSRSPRKLTLVRAQMREDLAWTKVAVGNISSTGLMVKHTRPPPVGARVEIAHRGVTVLGLVVWASATRFGVKSFQPIDVDAFTAGPELAQKTTVPEPERPALWHWSVRRSPPGSDT
jgi:hypothetical protein